MILRHCLASIALLIVLVAPVIADLPQLDLPSSITILNGAPLHLPLDGFDADGDPLTFSVSVSDPTRIETLIPTGNRSLELDVTGFGSMTFQLFEQRAPNTTSRIIGLAEDGFYDGVIFHRIVDNFVIQGGDPTGTGAGGSLLPDFDDEFHPDLLHSGPGTLAMAKSRDDTNNSQFFVTETATPHLDFNHSVFGILTDGEDVRDAISNVPIDNQSRPLSPIVMEAARIFEDTENGVLMLKALQATTEPTLVHVTVSDGTDSVTQMIEVLIAEDTFNHQPFLDAIPAMSALRDQEFTFHLAATDLEGDELRFEVATNLAGATVQVDATGLVSFMPPAGFQGEAEVAVRVFEASSPPLGSFSPQDVQVFSITVVPEPGSGFLATIGCLAALAARRRR